MLVPSRVELELAINELKYPKDKTYILPNVIDFEEFQKYKLAKLERPAIVFVGGMNYLLNREAAETIIKIALIFRDDGIKLRILEYMVSGKPIIATRKAIAND